MKLKKYQREAIQNLQTRASCFVIADTGAGKTIIALRAAIERGTRWRVCRWHADYRRPANLDMRTPL